MPLSKLIRRDDVNPSEVLSFEDICPKRATAAPLVINEQLESEKRAEERFRAVEKLRLDEESLVLQRCRLEQWEKELLDRESSMAEREQQIHQAAEEAGLAAGYREGWEAADNERKLLASVAQKIESSFLEIQKAAAPLTIELALHAARHVVHESCELSLGSAAINVARVIESLQLDPSSISIRASSKTFSSIANHDEHGNILGKIRFLPDESMEEMGFVVEHQGGAYDSSIETRWQRAISQLSSDMQYSKDDLQSHRAGEVTPPSADA